MPRSDFSSSRRSFLAGAGIAAATASGCCLTPSRPQIDGACDRRQSAFLAGPEVIGAWQRPERYFDAHTHFFNARDVPVGGCISKSFAHSIQDETLRQLAVALAPVAEALARLAPAPADEFGDLCARSRPTGRSLRAESDDLDREIEGRREDVSRELFREIVRQGQQIPNLINQATSAAQATGERSLEGQAPTFSLDFVREALRDGANTRDIRTGRLKGRSEAPPSPEAARVGGMKGVLQFVGFMLAPRHHNLRTFIQRNAEYSPGLPLSGCFAAMVDFNYWLDCPAKASHLEDQVRLHEQLSLASRGFLLPLVAYNPWVDILQDDASLKLVERAVRHHGCVGVKIYPPMGFYPYNNAGLALETKEKRPDSAQLDKKLAAFYALCESLDVPVMAHANESNGRDDAHDALASAKGWFELRDRLATLKQLRVNAGHFGGEMRHASGDWTDDFVRLMSEGGPLRVYGDLGYWNELVDSSEVQAKLKRVFGATWPGGGAASDRVMYGSDWLMLSRERGWEAYGETVSRYVRSLDGTGGLAAKVLGKNALACFGLDGAGHGLSLTRLLEHHRERTGVQPGWAAPSVNAS